MSDEKRVLWTPKRKQEVVLRLLKGESPQEMARELGLGMSTLYGWRDRFLEAGLEGLKYGGVNTDLLCLLFAGIKCPFFIGIKCPLFTVTRLRFLRPLRALTPGL